MILARGLVHFGARCRRGSCHHGCCLCGVIGTLGIVLLSSLHGQFMRFKVGHFLLIWIVFNNLYVTNVISRVVCGSPTTLVMGGGDITICHSYVL